MLFGFFLLSVDIGDEVVVFVLPARDEVYFVEGDDEWGFCLFEDVYAFECLWFEAFVNVYDEDGEVCEVAAAFSEVDEGGVSGCVDEEESGDGDVEFECGKEVARDFLECGKGNDTCADGLGDSSCFVCGNSAASDAVKDECFSVVDVP